MSPRRAITCEPVACCHMSSSCAVTCPRGMSFKFPLKIPFEIAFPIPLFVVRHGWGQLGGRRRPTARQKNTSSSIRGRTVNDGDRRRKNRFSILRWGIAHRHDCQLTCTPSSPSSWAVGYAPIAPRVCSPTNLEVRSTSPGMGVSKLIKLRIFSSNSVVLVSSYGHFQFSTKILPKEVPTGV